MRKRFGKGNHRIHQDHKIWPAAYAVDRIVHIRFSLVKMRTRCTLALVVMLAGVASAIGGGVPRNWAQQVGPYLPGASAAQSKPSRVMITDITRNWGGPWLRGGVYMNNHLNTETYAPTGGNACFVDGHIRWTPADKLDWDRWYNNANSHNTPTDYGWNFVVGFQP